jgi:hypothetical protein
MLSRVISLAAAETERRLRCKLFSELELRATINENFLATKRYLRSCKSCLYNNTFCHHNILSKTIS